MKKYSEMSKIQKLKIWAILLWCWIRYELKFQKGKGFYIRKRVWLWLLFSPVIFPYYILLSILRFINDLLQTEAHWIKSSTDKISFKQRISYTELLLR